MWLKFTKIASVLIDQSLPMRLLNALLHPIRVMHYQCWSSPAAIVQAAALLSTLLTYSPAFLHRKGKLWMTCKSRGLVQHAFIMGWELGCTSEVGGGRASCRYCGGEGVSLPGCFQSKWKTIQFPVIPSSLRPGSGSIRERWEDRPLTPSHEHARGM